MAAEPSAPCAANPSTQQAPIFIFIWIKHNFNSYEVSSAEKVFFITS